MALYHVALFCGLRIGEILTVEALIARRSLFSVNPRAAFAGSEAFSDLLHAGGHLPYRVDPWAVESLLDALRVEGEVLP